MKRVAGVLLAAGTSSRMGGGNKLLLPWRGMSLLRRAAMTAAGCVDPLIAVVGHEREKAEAELRGLPATLVFNPHYLQGAETSMRAGIAAVNADAAVILLADMPLVTQDLIRAVTESWNGEPLVVSRYGEVIAPPILYAKQLFAALQERPGKEVVAANLEQAHIVQQPPEALRDIDVPEDL